MCLLTKFYSYDTMTEWLVRIQTDTIVVQVLVEEIEPYPNRTVVLHSSIQRLDIQSGLDRIRWSSRDWGTDPGWLGEVVAE